MTPQHSLCEPERIEQFFRQQLSDDEQFRFERHLETCFKCRMAIETEAAQAEDWVTARESLSSEAVDLAGVDREIGFRSGADGDTGRRDALFSFLSPTDDPRMIGRLGGYEIVGLIGQGGMGVVFKGLDPALNRYVAIKALSPHLAASGSARLRFAREAKAAAAVTHENVVAIHGVAEWNGLPYLVMSYVRGESLQKRLDQHGPLGQNEVLRVGRQIAAGLAAAHSQGLVHRDIKPANILLEDGIERLKITDFGLARAVDDASLTRTGVIAGTPQFMSPEQARGEAIDARSDLFSLGSVLYAMCTGRPPFRAETSYGILRRITDTEPRPIQEINPEIPLWLVRLISRLHAKNPSERFESAGEVAEVFEQCLAHVQQPTVVLLPSMCRPKVAPLRWIRKGLMAFALLALIITSSLMYSMRPKQVTETKSEEASENSISSAVVPIKNGLSEPHLPPDTSSQAVTSTEWDETMSEIETLKQDGNQYELRVNQLWDD